MLCMRNPQGFLQSVPCMYFSSPQVTVGIMQKPHIWLHQFEAKGWGHETTSCLDNSLVKGTGWFIRGWGLGLKNITRGHFVADYSLTFSCLVGHFYFWQLFLQRVVQRHVRCHLSCWPWLWLGGTAVCANEAVSEQTSKAAVLKQTRAPLRLHEAPGHVNNDLMRMHAITVINTAHVKHCQLSRVSGRYCITLKRLACNDHRS